MKFYYLVAAYNEEAVLESTIQSLSILPKRFPGSQVFILVNGSNDGTWTIAQKLSKINPDWVTSFHTEEKGMGAAFRLGLRALKKQNLSNNDWIVFCASDLPFGFSDLESFLKLSNTNEPENILYVGSKRHPASVIQRNWKRRLGSIFFEIARRIILRIKTKDTQGSLFLRGDQVSIVDQLRSNDYFVTVEIVYFSEKNGKVIEMPISLQPEMRSSKISLLKDGYKILAQLINFRLNR